MYGRRVKIFILLIALFFAVCVFRLTQMQLLSHSYYQDRIAELSKGRSRQLKTIRGRILDRNHRVLADDEPQFQLCIGYTLACLLDQRVQPPARYKSRKNKLQDLQHIIDKCARFNGVDRSQIEQRIQRINDFVWNRRTFQAWRTNYPDSELLRKYDQITGIPLSEVVVDFEKRQPSSERIIQLINKTEIAEMFDTWPLLDLETDDDVFTAQLEFLDYPQVQVLPKVKRFYPYGSAACHSIGWVGPPQKNDRELFADDALLSYLDQDVCGREDGVEYVCETTLRGRRGKAVYDLDRNLVSRIPTRFGKDVTLTLDIELQQRIEKLLTSPELNPNHSSPAAVVVIEVATGDILAMVSTPVFDLNRIRYDYGALAGDPNEPLRNRAINKQYPPGSVVKPLILIAGLESSKVGATEVISCPAQPAPTGWPGCWIYNRYKSGHDSKWLNIARNAIKGSCNIYFSRLAARLEPRLLQQWLFKFGYGQEILMPPGAESDAAADRNFRQAPGQTASGTTSAIVSSFDEVPTLDKSELKFFGIGQGNLRVTPLQVANQMAVIARGGKYTLPQLFICEQNDTEPNALARRPSPKSRTLESTDLNISAQNLAVVFDGMSAVVNEPGGTAYGEFANSGLAELGVKVYGKTGSTEKPDHAWFGGFALNNKGGGIAIAVVVEGGQHGSSDAAPLARETIRFCVQAGYLGSAKP